ncbi:MAG: hypothetical protein DCF19_13725 [Pseudanabaena frigida]|uniref:Pepco domain-containing protein n=1 Tax=Pseudanabaena frigida TaxID=945775 RepID=A0A2W4W8N6_9CYAN|nr:MAG: hypothetical protein DCF19_13725 [Pseudanabaena frigida]
MQEQDWGNEELWIVTASDRQESQSGQKTVAFSPPNPTRSGATVSGEAIKESRVKAENLAAQMSQFVRVIGRVFADAQKQIDPQAGLQLDEIKLAVDISAKGEIKLLGTGIETSGKGAIELKFKRAELPKKSQPSESV